MVQKRKGYIAMFEQISTVTDGTDNYYEYISENFQLTHGEAIAGIRYIDIPPQRFAPTIASPTVRLIVIDGELYLLDEGAPPGWEPLPEDAGILQARRH